MLLIKPSCRKPLNGNLCFWLKNSKSSEPKPSSKQSFLKQKSALKRWKSETNIKLTERRDDMAIDQIHDLQQVYRKLLHSMSRPGTISSMGQESENMDVDCGCDNALMLSAMALLDAEVTFHVLSETR